MITVILDLLFHRLVALKSTCLVTCPLGSSLEPSGIHFVRQQPTEPSDCQVATGAHFRHFNTYQSDLSDVSRFVVFLISDYCVSGDDENSNSGI